MKEVVEYDLNELDSPEVAIEDSNVIEYSLDELESAGDWEQANGGLKILENLKRGAAQNIARIPSVVGSIFKEEGEKGNAGYAIPSFREGMQLAASLRGQPRLTASTDEAFIRIGEKLNQKNQEFIQRLNLNPTDESAVSRVAFDVGGGAASLATSLGILGLTKNPALAAALFGARQKSEIYEEARATKSPEEASAISTAAGLLEGGIEQIGGMSFLKSISFNKFLNRTLVRAGIEAVEEGAQQAGESALTNVTDIRNERFQDVLLKIGYASTLGFVLGAPGSAVFTALENSSVKTELKALGFNDEQSSKIMQKVTEKTISDGTVKLEIEKAIDEEISATEKALNEALPNVYDQAFQKRQEKQGEGFQKIYDSVSGGLSQAMEPISTRLGQISPALKTRLRRYEFDLKQRTLMDEKTVKPFLEAYQKLSPKDQSDLDLALKNSDMEKVTEITTRNNMTAQYQAARETLTGLHERAKATGLDIGFIENYFPRKVKDFDAMLKHFGKEDSWPEMQKAINEKEQSLGRKITDDEKTEMLNSMLRGIKSGSARLARPGNVKERQISQVSPELLPFYQDSPQALLQYIYRVNDFIEARRFFGKSVKGEEMSAEAIEQSIGALTLDLLQSGEISGREAKDVSDILTARFSQSGPGQLASAIRNITYIETMGSVNSAVTQIGDIAFSLYKNGFYRTGKALTETLTGRAAITKEDIGIERIAEEFADRSKTGKALDRIFKLTGLDYMDRLGKETQINAAFDKFSDLASKNSPEFKEQMQTIFGEESAQVTEDLKTKNATDNVKFLLFSELADVQPIALSEMPEQYLRFKSGRLLYMLKTFTIKQIDVFRNEAFLKMKTNPVQGLKNLVRLSSFLILANSTADMIKDLILNRETELPDYVLNNIFRLFGVSKYTYFKFKVGGASEAITSVVVPPFGDFLGSGARDIDKMIKGEFEPEEAEIIQSIPLLGKLYYWWFGAGRSKEERKAGSGAIFS